MIHTSNVLSIKNLHIYNTGKYYCYGHTLNKTKFLSEFALIVYSKNNWRASVASGTLFGVTDENQKKICIYVCM